MYIKKAFYLLNDLAINKDDIINKFKVFTNWDILKKDNYDFLRELFYGANINNTNQKESIKYLSYIVCNFLYFLTENMYHRIINKYYDLNELSKTYVHIFDNESNIFNSLEEQLDSLKIQLNNDVLEKVRIKLNSYKLTDEKYKFGEFLSQLEIKLHTMFKNKSKFPINTFLSSSKKQKIDPSYKYIFGIDAMGSSYALKELLKLENKEEYKLILLGGEHIIWDFHIESKSIWYEKLINNNIIFKSFIFPEKDKPSDSNFEYLKFDHYNPFPLYNYRGDYYAFLFLNCINNGFLDEL